MKRNEAEILTRRGLSRYVNEVIEMSSCEERRRHAKLVVMVVLMIGSVTVARAGNRIDSI